jgi:pimeloyl-ACP methyl ester carboxylesterase
VWALLWCVLIALGIYVVTLAPEDLRTDFSVDRLVGSLFPNAMFAIVAALAVAGLVAWLSSSFVDVARYLDTSPRSYEVRRAIRGGMVDLLTALQDSRKYERIVVVAHSLGAFIAYDAMCTLWNSSDDRVKHEFAALAALETAANRLPPRDQPVAVEAEEIGTFRKAQTALWREMRRNELPWLITDFVSVGTPMYMADLLITSNRSQFDTLTGRSEIPQCPPTSDTRAVEDDTSATLSYGWRNRPRLVTGSPFAVVRWTNLWFPSRLGVFGDWFGGPLRPLFGAGITDTPVTGNTPGRYTPAIAHSKYFAYADADGDDDIATCIRRALALDEDAGPTVATLGPVANMRN